MGSQSKWYNDEFEYNYVEALILICLIVIAIVFEQVWHRVQHEAEHAFVYGRLSKLHIRGHAAAHLSEQGSYGRLKHECLTQQFISRCGGEFMTLGVLAFVVFLFNSCGGFEAMEDLHKTHPVPLPNSAGDWLHLVELVHIKLFVAMIVYFVIIGSTVRVCDHHFQKWEGCHIYQTMSITNSKSQAEMDLDKTADPTLAEYDLWQKYFFEKILSWKNERGHLYKALLDKLEIEAGDPDRDRHLEDALMHQFSFASFLAVNVSEGMIEMIHVHPAAWACLLVLFSGFALMHRFAKVDLFLLSYVFGGCTVLLLTLMDIKVRIDHRRITKFMGSVESRRSQSTSREFNGVRKTLTSVTCRREICRITSLDRPTSLYDWFARFNLQDWMVSILQVVLFLVCYVFSRTLMDFHDWEERTQESVMICIGFLLLFMVLTRSLHALPKFLALTAMPPYCASGYAAHIFSVIEDEMALADRGPRSRAASRAASRATSRAPSQTWSTTPSEFRNYDLPSFVPGPTTPTQDARHHSCHPAGIDRHAKFQEMRSLFANPQLSESELLKQWEKLEDDSICEKSDARIFERGLKAVTDKIEEFFVRLDRRDQRDTVIGVAKKMDDLSGKELLSIPWRKSTWLSQWATVEHLLAGDKPDFGCQAFSWDLEVCARSNTLSGDEHQCVRSNTFSGDQHPCCRSRKVLPGVDLPGVERTAWTPEPAKELHHSLYFSGSEEDSNV